jgi:hypothetical protein
MNRGSTPWEITLLSSNLTGMQIQQHAIDPTNPAGETTGPVASLQNEAPRVLKRSRPGNGRHMQQIPSFCFIAADNGVAPEKLQVRDPHSKARARP